jgi:dihydroorotate dehydrogenase (fumarate)
MTDLSTTYMGLSLPTPIIAGASRLTRDIEGIRACAEAGAGAVVLKSLFEEEITSQVDDLVDASKGSMWHPEAAQYIERFGKEGGVQEYLDLISRAKREVDVPVIGSVHCVSAGQWTEFAGRMEKAGADAVELNVFVMPSDPRRDGRENEQVYFDVLKEVKHHVSIPVALKVGTFFSSISRTLLDLSRRGADALVLFNRYYAPDFDVEKMSLVPADFLSTPRDIVMPLRWVGIMSPLVKCDIAATGGVHDGTGAVKQLLAGADAVQVCSALYRQGIGHLSTMVGDISDWMERHDFDRVSGFRGRLSMSRSENPAAFERVQFMKTSVGIE